jgi:hypothetical protein
MKEKEKLILEITMGPHRTLHLVADNMNEMVEKIKEWQDWNKTEEILKEFNKSPSIITREKKSGWYYFP